MSDGTDREQDLRATTDAIRADIDRLDDLERQKQALRAGDRELDRVSHEAVALADRIGREARAELQIGAEIGDGPAGGAPEPA